MNNCAPKEVKFIQDYIKNWNLYDENVLTFEFLNPGADQTSETWIVGLIKGNAVYLLYESMSRLFVIVICDFSIFSKNTCPVVSFEKNIRNQKGRHYYIHYIFWDPLVLLYSKRKLLVIGLQRWRPCFNIAKS